MNRRTERLGELFRQEISKILADGIKDPRIGFATISRVEVSEDLSYAKVWVAVLGSDKEKNDTLIALGRSAGYIRSILYKSIKIRKIPEFNFVLDESLAHSARIQEILGELREAGEFGDDEKSPEGAVEE